MVLEDEGEEAAIVEEAEVHLGVVVLEGEVVVEVRIIFLI